MSDKDSIIFCGDTMLGGVLPYQDMFIDDSTVTFLRSADTIVGTLEAPIGTNLEFDRTKSSGRCNIIYFQDKEAYRLQKLNFNAVSLANNHIFDLGVEGFLNTVNTLKNLNIRYFGAGLNIDEASQPVVINKANATIALFGYCSLDYDNLGYVPEATKNSYGVNPLIIDNVLSDIKNAKRKHDFVVIMPHWGKEFTPHPLIECQKMAHQMIESGADMVIGSHTHMNQPVIRYKKKYIAYSLGNFLFPDFYVRPPRPIWYPKSLDDVKGFERIMNYPYPIKNDALYVWPHKTRIGLALKMKIRNKQIVGLSKQYLEMSRDNILELKKLSVKQCLYNIILTYIYQIAFLNKIYKIFDHMRKSLNMLK